MSRRLAGRPRLAPHPIAFDTARLGTIRHIERLARSLKESPPIGVAERWGLPRTSNLRAASVPRQRLRGRPHFRNLPSPRLRALSPRLSKHIASGVGELGA